MAEPTIQLGGGNWAGKSDNLLGYYKEGERFYKQDFTFSRSTTGTYTDSEGYIQEMPYNLVTYSEDYTQWTLVNGTLYANSTISPDGTLNASKVVFNSNGLDLKRTITVTANTTYTYSFYIKLESGTGLQGRFYDNSNSANIEYYTYSSQITGTDWTRVTREITTPSGCTEMQIWLLAASSSLVTASFWGAQLNKGTSAKTYFPTTTRLNMPRVDYKSNSNGSLILEPQSTNLVTDSNANFIINQCTIAYNDTTSPEGITNAYKATATGTSGSFVRTGYISFTDSSAFSVFLKYGNNQWVQIINSGDVNHYVNVDIQNGVFGTSGSDTSDLLAEDYGNGWYRISGKFVGYSGSGSFRVYMGSTSNAGWAVATAIVDNYYYGYGFQVESNASFATSYIPTSGSSVTRNQDTCSITNVADRINSSEGVLFVETSYVNKGYGNSIAITDGTNSQRVQMYFNNSNLSLLLVIKVNDTMVATHTVSSSGINWDSTNKIAIKYKTNDMSFWLNGTKVATDTSGTMFSANTLTKLGFDSGSDGSFYGKCNQIQVYSTALSDTELATLTT